jgi:hypothetical protein
MALGHPMVVESSKGVVALGIVVLGCASRTTSASEPPRREVQLSAGERAPELVESRRSMAPTPDPVEGVAIAETPLEQVDDVGPPPSGVFTGERAPGFTIESLMGSSGITIVRCSGCWMAAYGDRGGQTSTYIDASAGVSRARGEWLVEQPGGRAVLRQRDIWVDPKTRGARLIRTHDIELTRVNPRSVSTPVYAVHRGGDVVVVAPTPGKWEWGEDGDYTGATSCDLMQFELEPDPGGGWTPPVLLRGPVAEATNVDERDGPPGIEIQAFQAAINTPAKVRVRPRTR